MVLVELAGGLGNQMFQYATARALADRIGSDVALDLRMLSQDKLRKLELLRWRVNARPAAEPELKKFPLWGARVARRLQRFGVSTRYYAEPKFGFDARLFERRGSLRLCGYFQSEKYFGRYRNALLREFVPTDAPSGANADLAYRIAAAQSVSVHVRRGDYATDPRILAVHGVCGADYYARAFEVIRSRVGLATYFVFSDDLEWAKSNIHPPGERVLVTGNAERPETDIHLMSLCAHNICANSSFSWWGAWLNARQEKIVVAPVRWFASDRYDSTHLIPDQWLKVA